MGGGDKALVRTSGQLVKQIACHNIERVDK
jgi:hypothetical protein